ncbi:tRNA-dihydrouridine synthase [Entomospira entomophila]|uniref:tRNA-dihydrouridine synthase n=1 Tax=Entomospira entomophila TaxID=2719988 RepID=A0A968KRE6_9SPIO|nr:tRNA-dihydrouridine synthase [Entomospira entomophilus]NIZ40694.1 tRNA-dihydrouridine synthase [Entomospira entomophilus]WDI34907.1 tRNA-dihydrouridine synthase [Entomospira entomophilus]
MKSTSQYYKPLQIGTIQLEGNLILAPMAGYTDRAFRQIAMENGANLAYAEMSSCEALWRGEREKTQQIMTAYPHEEHLALQIFSGNIEAVQSSIQQVIAFQPSIVDLNIGCPVQKVNKSGAGSALLQRPQELKAILSFMREAIPKEIAVTAKFRSGWNQESLNYLEIAELALEAGCDMITLHPRTRAQGYSGVANWQQLKELKETFPEAVICASGDLNSPEQIQTMFEQTGVDAAMIARGSIGHPTIFQETRDLLQHGSYTMVDPHQNMKIAHQHYLLSLEYLGERYTINEIKKHLAQYARGTALLAHYRKLLVLAQTKDEIDQLFQELLSEISENSARACTKN